MVIPIPPSYGDIPALSTRSRITTTMSGLPAYAPTATTSYTPADNPNVNFHQEFSRATLLPTTVHKAVYESLCEIFSIATVLEMIENSFLKDYITDKEKYTSTVMRMINQYQMLLKGFGKTPTHKSVLAEILPGIEDTHDNLLPLMQEKFRLHVPLAIERLTSGVPATIQHFHTVVESTSEAKDESTTQPPGLASALALARLVAEATGSFITLMDALKLNYKTKSQLHPLLSDLVVSLNDLVLKENDSSKPIDFPGKSKLVGWLIKLNNLEENQELAQDETDQFLDELDEAYKGFFNSLE